MGQAKKRAAEIAKLKQFTLRSDEDIRGKAKYNIELDGNGDDRFMVYAFYYGKSDIRLLYQRLNETLDDFKTRLDQVAKTCKVIAPTYLYRKGYAQIDCFAVRQTVTDSCLKTVEVGIQEAVLTLYDVIWPDVAEATKRFADTVMEAFANCSLPQFNRSFIEVLVSTGAARKLTHTQSLQELLEQAKTKLRDEGKVDTTLGIIPQSGATLFFSVKIPYEQRRYFRTVSEIARRLHARSVILVGDARNKVDNTEMLIARQVDSDGSCISIASSYERIVSEGKNTIVFSSNLSETGKLQDLLPAWGEHVQVDELSHKECK